MKKNILLTVLSTILIIALVGCSCATNTSNGEKTTATNSKQTSNMNSEETTTKEVADNSTSTTNPSSEEVTTSADVTTNEVSATAKDNTTTNTLFSEEETTSKVDDTTKPTETTTKKPVATTSKKPTSTTSTSKPSKEEETTTSSKKWVPEYYTAGTEDDIGDGLDEYRVGLQKYTLDGTQLYVVTNNTTSPNGYYYANEEVFEEKNAAFEKAFVEVYDPQYTASYSMPSSHSDLNIYFAYWSYSTSSGDMAPGYEARALYVWDEVRMMIIYKLIIPYYTIGAYEDKYGNDINFENIEELIQIYNQDWNKNITIEQYLEGERLCQKYGVDWHNYIEFFK